MTAQSLVIQQLTPAQIPAVVLLESEATDYPWSERMYADGLRAGYWIGALAGVDGISGLAVVTSAAGEANLLNIWVSVKQQGSGRGRRLLNGAIEHARKSAASKFFLEVREGNGRARRLYESVGFSRIGLRKDYYPGTFGREHAVCMALNLQQPSSR